jgi:cbb3-type cytochrome oxidase subunit 3
MEMIREGLLRFWVICTILFFAAVGAWFFRPVQKEFERADFAERIQSSATLLVPIACREARGVAGSDYLNDIDRANCWYDLPKLRKLYPEYKDTPDGALAAAMIQKVGWRGGPRRPWIPLLKLGAATIALPLIALLWGWALLRVAERLYRRNRDRQ